MSIHGVLGETISYPKIYAPEILHSISREIGRNEIADVASYDGVYQGVDIWQAFELSWLNPKGISQVAMARLLVPANSPNIVESKSLKLYLNGLNFSVFANIDEVEATIKKDVSICVGVEIGVEIIPLTSDKMFITSPIGVCIDTALDDGVPIALTDDIDSRILSNPKTDTWQTHQLYSHLLRSNCPVTNQPDWATVQICMTTDKQVNHGAVLAYILSFRQHNGFHEQCVERIFADFMRIFNPKSLWVQANYTRRGGIDINPIRVFGDCEVPAMQRLVRQ